MSEWESVSHARVEAIGGTVTRGDSEMDTDRGDRVQTWVRTELYIDRSRNAVRCRVQWRCDEDGGDRTRIEGDHDRHVWAAPEGRSIVSLDAEGGPNQEFNVAVQGENHGFNPLPVGRTYWEEMSIKVDDRGRSDHERAGVRGQLGFRVEIA